MTFLMAKYVFFPIIDCRTVEVVDWNAVSLLDFKYILYLNI